MGSRKRCQPRVVPVRQGPEKTRTILHRTTSCRHPAQIEEMNADGLACLRGGEARVRTTAPHPRQRTAPIMGEDVGAMSLGAGR
jgi:hypothetical protein